MKKQVDAMEELESFRVRKRSKDGRSSCHSIIKLLYTYLHLNYLCTLLHSILNERMHDIIQKFTNYIIGECIFLNEIFYADACANSMSETNTTRSPIPLITFKLHVQVNQTSLFIYNSHNIRIFTLFFL